MRVCYYDVMMVAALRLPVPTLHAHPSPMPTAHACPSALHFEGDFPRHCVAQVYLFSSRRPHERASFVRIITATANVTSTPSHYLYARRAGVAPSSLPTGLAGWELLPAGELRLGDAVLVARDGQAAPSPAVVTGVAEVASDVGVYNPHTRAGAIVVDGIVASELTSFMPRWAAHPYSLRATATALHTAFAVLPRSADSLVASMLSSLAHGGPGDAIVNRDAFLHTPMSALA